MRCSFVHLIYSTAATAKHLEFAVKLLYTYGSISSAVNSTAVAKTGDSTVRWFRPEGGSCKIFGIEAGKKQKT